MILKAYKLKWKFLQKELHDPKRIMNREQRYTEWLVDFYKAIYLKALNMGIDDINNITKYGLSGYAGAAKCQQAYNGMYLRLPGTVQECPGRCIGAQIQEDVRTQNLITTWIDSRNYRRSVFCRALCAVKMKDLTGSKVKVCDCCHVYENVGSMPLELENRVIAELYNLTHESEYAYN